MKTYFLVQYRCALRSRYAARNQCQPIKSIVSNNEPTARLLPTSKDYIITLRDNFRLFMCPVLSLVKFSSKVADAFARSGVDKAKGSDQFVPTKVIRTDLAAGLINALLRSLSDVLGK